MPIDSKAVGANDRLIQILGDPFSSGALAGVLTVINARNLSGLHALIVQNVPLLENPAGTKDMQAAAAGTTGVPSVNTEGTKATYAVGVLGFTPVATPTDFWAIIGSATKTVRVLRVVIAGIATAAISVDTFLIKRSTASTGGTPTPLTAPAYDSGDAAATAVVDTYAANPSPLGTSLGNAGAEPLNLGVTGFAGKIVWDFTTRNNKGLVLRGVAQSLNLNWGGVAVPAGTKLGIAVEWSEEPV